MDTYPPRDWPIAIRPSQINSKPGAKLGANPNQVPKPGAKPGAKPNQVQTRCFKPGAGRLAANVAQETLCKLSCTCQRGFEIPILGEGQLHSKKWCPVSRGLWCRPTEKPTGYFLGRMHTVERPIDCSLKSVHDESRDVMGYT